MTSRQFCMALVYGFAGWLVIAAVTLLAWIAFAYWSAP